MSRKRRLPAFVMAPLVLALSAACRQPRNPAERPSVWSVQLSTEPVSLDPALAEDGASLRVLSNVMQGLVGYNGSGELENQLADSYQISPDGKRYEFKLRATARWSDGTPVTAEQFVAGFRRALS